MKELRNQLKSQDLSSLLPSSIEQVGGSVFPDDPSAVDLLAFDSIINAWRKVHVPSYGSPLANSGQIVSVVGNEDLLSPLNNEVYAIKFVSFTNAGGAAPVVVQLTAGGFPIQLDGQQNLNTLAIPPSSTLTLAFDFSIGKNLALAPVVSSGTASDLTTKALVLKTSQ